MKEKQSAHPVTSTKQNLSLIIIGFLNNSRISQHHHKPSITGKLTADITDQSKFEKS